MSSYKKVRTIFNIRGFSPFQHLFTQLGLQEWRNEGKASHYSTNLYVDLAAFLEIETGLPINDAVVRPRLMTEPIISLIKQRREALKTHPEMIRWLRSPLAFRVIPENNESIASLLPQGIDLYDFLHMFLLEYYPRNPSVGGTSVVLHLLNMPVKLIAELLNTKVETIADEMAETLANMHHFYPMAWWLAGIDPEFALKPPYPSQALHRKLLLDVYEEAWAGLSVVEIREYLRRDLFVATIEQLQELLPPKMRRAPTITIIPRHTGGK